MGYGDLWGFISQISFIINPCLDLWGFMRIYGKPRGDIKSPHEKDLWGFMGFYGDLWKGCG